LEKIRYEERLDVLFNIKGEIENVKVAPLIFLTFLENSFKHGIGQTVSEAWVSVDIEVVHGELIIKIENSKDENGSRNEGPMNGGIGLKNVRRRLDLLYPGRYELEICDDRNSFLVILKIAWQQTAVEVTS